MEPIAIKNKKKKKNTQIEGLRGVAILIIVVFISLIDFNRFILKDQLYG